MKDLISREDLISAICDNFERSKFYLRLDFIELISKMPVADVVEVKRGEWIEYPECFRYINAYSPDHVVCSVCEECFSFLDDSIDRFDFCPHCGADMRGGI